MAGALREEREKYAGRESISDAGSIAADIEANKAALSALAELEKAASEPPVPAVEVTAAIARRVATRLHRVTLCANVSDMTDVLRLWQAELGPALGLVAWREPTPEECERINWFAHNTIDALAETQEVRPKAIGRAMFDAVREVMGGGK